MSLLTNPPTLATLRAEVRSLHDAHPELSAMGYGFGWCNDHAKRLAECRADMLTDDFASQHFRARVFLEEAERLGLGKRKTAFAFECDLKHAAEDYWRVHLHGYGPTGFKFGGFDGYNSDGYVSRGAIATAAMQAGFKTDHERVFMSAKAVHLTYYACRAHLAEKARDAENEANKSITSLRCSKTRSIARYHRSRIRLAVRESRSGEFEYMGSFSIREAFEKLSARIDEQLDEIRQLTK